MIPFIKNETELIAFLELCSKSLINSSLLPEPITTKLMFFTRSLRFGPVETNRNQLPKGVDSQLIVPRGRYASER